MKLVNNAKTKNFKFVKVREQHTCKHCGAHIPKGTECLTVNKKLQGRRWICCNCVENYLDYREALDIKNNVSFGDEGSAMFAECLVAECADVLYDCGVFDIE